CSDSRVNPSLITSSQPGELFIIRNVGNLVPPYAPNSEYHSTAAGIEYAVSVLGVTDVIVCGHSHCGAIDGTYENIDNPSLVHVKKWLELADEAKHYVNENVPDGLPLKQRLELTEKVSVLFQLENLLTYPEIKKKVNEGELFLRGWFYHINSCVLEYYNDEKKVFMPMESK
ncbi:MAG: carbonic anhydrase, partial [Campylobacteraceae bacterium]